MAINTLCALFNTFRPLKNAVRCKFLFPVCSRLTKFNGGGGVCAFSFVPLQPKTKKSDNKEKK